MSSSSCKVERRFEPVTGKLDVATGEVRIEKSETLVGACAIPLFTPG